MVLAQSPRDLNKFPWKFALLNTDYVQLTGGSSAQFYNYPRKEENHGIGGPTEHHLIYQGTLQEELQAEPTPFPFHNVFPEAFITGNFLYSSSIEKLYDCIAPYGIGSNYTHHIDMETWNTAQFGSALHFSERLIYQNIDNLPNFNLDSDRGYGWKTWVADNIIANSNPVEIHYIN